MDSSSWIGSNPKAAEKAMLEIRNANYNISSMMKRDSLISSLQEEYNPLRLMSPESINRLLYFSHLSVYKEGQVGIANYQFIENFRWAKDQEMIDRQGKIQMTG
ncbi:MAG: hypothetical protein U5K54_25735 [Cytophagales bacterium]|nr:hypothetical protein [Cytophagales bacterium]